jgi:hypothetical protein
MSQSMVDTRCLSQPSCDCSPTIEVAKMRYSWCTARSRLTPERPKYALAAGAATSVRGSDAPNSRGNTLEPVTQIKSACSIRQDVSSRGKHLLQHAKGKTLK